MSRRPLVTATLVASSLAAVAPAAAQNSVTIDGTFSDWSDEFCVDDPQGCNDESGQRDADSACIANNFPATSPSPATIIYLRFDFDEVSMPGGNTVDACWLVDVDQNGNSDAALCFTGEGNPLVLQAGSPVLYLCGDSSVSCASPSVQPLPAGTSCAMNAGVTPLMTCPSDSADAAVECSVPLSAMGYAGSGNVTLLQSCTFNSSQPNSVAVDCVVGGGNPPLVIDPTTGGNVPVELQSFAVE